MIKINGKQNVEIEITKKELGYAIMKVVFEMAMLSPDYDDAGCDWLTAGCSTFIDNKQWLVSRNPHIATLVDAANIISYGEPKFLE